MAISASEARQRLFPLIQQVNNDHEPVRIASRAGDAVLMSAADYDSWTARWLVGSPGSSEKFSVTRSRVLGSRSRSRVSCPGTGPGGSTTNIVSCTERTIMK